MRLSTCYLKRNQMGWDVAIFLKMVTRVTQNAKSKNDFMIRLAYNLIPQKQIDQNSFAAVITWVIKYQVIFIFFNFLFQSKYEFNVCLDHAHGKFLNERSKSIDPDLVISVENAGSEPIYCSCSPAEYDEINSWLIENNRFDTKNVVA